MALPHQRRVGLTAIAALALIMTVLVAPAAADTEIKTFTASAEPKVVSAGDTVTFALTITNDLGTPHEIGSANISLPDAFGGGVEELRDMALAPGDSTTIYVTQLIPCVSPGFYDWGIAVKQSNDFNGPGNDFVGTAPVTEVSSGCYLAFTAAPGDGERNQPLATTDFGNAADDPITVGVFDGSGYPTSAWDAPIALQLVANPGGATVASGVAIPSDGVATFSQVALDRSASGYTMRAVSTDGVTTLTSDPSAEFTVVDKWAPCSGAGCTASTSSTNGLGLTEATVSSTSTTGGIVMSFDSATTPDLDCDGYDEVSSLLEFDVLDGDPTVGKTVVLSWHPWEQPARKYRVCWGAPTPFTTRDGVQAESNADGWYVGLLPNCRNNGPVAPCVSGYSQSRKDGVVTITVLAPAGDPVMRI